MLQWSLKLEEQGIFGNDMQFSEPEKDAAKNPVLDAEKYMVVNAAVYIAGTVTGGSVTGRDSSDKKG